MKHQSIRVIALPVCLYLLLAALAMAAQDKYTVKVTNGLSSSSSGDSESGS